MKKFFFISLYLLISNISFAQITTSKVKGGSVVTKVGMGFSINNGSTLTREWIVLNDSRCPLQLSDNVGINTIYSSLGNSFTPTGSLNPSEPVAAYEIHHVLYDVFGGHIITLSNTNVTDMNASTSFGKIARWHASKNQVSEYLICVSYVANVRTLAGAIWRYSPRVIKQELNKIQIVYEEDYSPLAEDEEK